jgi:hypothetical protein
MIVVRAAPTDVTATCGGLEMVSGKAPSGTGQPNPSQQAETQLGKRHVAEEFGLELLCTHAGTGVLAVKGIR